MLNNFTKTFCLTRGKHRYEILTGNRLYKEWMNEPLIAWDDKIFKLSYHHFPKKEIELKTIVGSSHTDYNGLNSWLEFLGALKKVHSQEGLTFYSHFFKDNKETTDVLVAGHNGKYWIVGGNNRICIAKFMSIESIIVSVNEYY
jgi:hypothetical protein